MSEQLILKNSDINEQFEKEKLDKTVEKATAGINNLLKEYVEEHPEEYDKVGLMEFEIVSIDEAGVIVDTNFWYSFNLAMIKDVEGKKEKNNEQIDRARQVRDANGNLTEIEKILNELSKDDFSKEVTFYVQNPTIENLTRRALEIIKKFQFIPGEIIEEIMEDYDKKINLATATTN